MEHKEKQEIKEMVETAKYLADNDPASLMLIKSNIEILKSRCDIDKETQVTKTG